MPTIDPAAAARVWSARPVRGGTTALVTSVAIGTIIRDCPDLARQVETGVGGTPVLEVAHEKGHVPKLEGRGSKGSGGEQTAKRLRSTRIRDGTTPALPAPRRELPAKDSE